MYRGGVRRPEVWCDDGTCWYRISTVSSHLLRFSLNVCILNILKALQTCLPWGETWRYFMVSRNGCKGYLGSFTTSWCHWVAKSLFCWRLLFGTPWDTNSRWQDPWWSKTTVTKGVINVFKESEVKSPQPKLQSWRTLWKSAGDPYHENHPENFIYIFLHVLLFQLLFQEKDCCNHFLILCSCHLMASPASRKPWVFIALRLDKRSGKSGSSPVGPAAQMDLGPSAIGISEFKILFGNM